MPDSPQRPRSDRPVRVAAVQLGMRETSTVDALLDRCSFFVRAASDIGADFVLFPELLNTPLLAAYAHRPGPGPEAAAKLTEHTPRFVERFRAMAVERDIHVIAGSILTVVAGELRNVAYLVHRDGRVDAQHKIHVTPSEHAAWGVRPGNRIEVFETDRGPVGIAICYDVEFPELPRILRQKGAEIVFVPYNTDFRAGHLRVRSCAAARAVENHCFVVTAGAVGVLPGVPGVDVHYASSAVLTPSDVQFPRDAIAAEATPEVETMIVADLDVALLRRTLREGTVRPWLDRRTDLYDVTYEG